MFLCIHVHVGGTFFSPEGLDIWSKKTEKALEFDVIGVRYCNWKQNRPSFLLSHQHICLDMSTKLMFCLLWHMCLVLLPFRQISTRSGLYRATHNHLSDRGCIWHNDWQRRGVSTDFKSQVSHASLLWLTVWCEFLSAWNNQQTGPDKIDLQQSRACYCVAFFQTQMFFRNTLQCTIKRQYNKDCDRGHLIFSSLMDQELPQLASFSATSHILLPGWW